MSRKILYIGNIIDSISSGADVANSNNIEALKEVSSNNLKIIELSEPSFIDKVFLYTGGLTPEVVRFACKYIKENNISIVFLSSSMLGRLAKTIKKRFHQVIIITFYHNIERHYAYEQYKVAGFSKLKTLITLSYNEKLAIVNTDYNIVLNERDNNLMLKYYNKSADLVLPICYKDVYPGEASILNHRKKIALFVGSAFFANIEGIRWYIKNVKPYVSDMLIVVGNGMDAYADEFVDKDIKVFGFTEDLSSFYAQADYVIMPIFSGGGMKTKTAEAFMYGKVVLGTPEAFEGYTKLDDSFAIICKNAEDFINMTKEVPLKVDKYGFNQRSREYFLNNHTAECSVKRIKEFFDKIA